MTPKQHITTTKKSKDTKCWEATKPGNTNVRNAQPTSSFNHLRLWLKRERRKATSWNTKYWVTGLQKPGPYLTPPLPTSKTRQYISHFKLNKGQENAGQSRRERLVADFHVVLMAVVGAVNLGFGRPRRAIPLYRLGRQSRVVRILLGLPILLAAIALFFFIIIPGDLSKRDTFVTCTVAVCAAVFATAPSRGWR